MSWHSTANLAVSPVLGPFIHPFPVHLASLRQPGLHPGEVAFPQSREIAIFLRLVQIGLSAVDRTLDVFTNYTLHIVQPFAGGRGPAKTVSDRDERRSTGEILWKPPELNSA